MRFANFLNIFVPASILLGLQACGVVTGQGRVAGMVDSSPPSYDALTSAAASSSALGGSVVALILAPNGSVLGVEVDQLAGRMDHSTGAVSVSNSRISFSDADGPTGGNTYVDGTSTVTTAGNPMQGVAGFAGSYQYVTSLDFVSPSYEAIGFVGIVTQESDLPVAGDAYYAGEFYATYLGAVSDVFLTGKNQITVQFGVGSVDVILYEVTATDTAGAAVATPVTGMRGRNIALDGNTFYGGTWEVSNGGLTLDLGGGPLTSVTEGTFFGYDPATSAPAEAAGVTVIEGATEAIIAGFVGKTTSTIF